MADNDANNGSYNGEDDSDMGRSGGAVYVDNVGPPITFTRCTFNTNRVSTAARRSQPMPCHHVAGDARQPPQQTPWQTPPDFTCTM